MGAPKILLIEDDESYVNSVRLFMRDHPVEIVWAPSGAQGLQLYRKSPLSYATVIVDYLLPDYRGSEVAPQIRRINPLQDILFASGYDKEPDYLRDMLTAGCSRTFIVKGQPVEQTRDTILTSIRLYENKFRVLKSDAAGDYGLPNEQYGLIGRSVALRKMIESIDKYRSAGVWVRIIGETGVGKELVAKALVPKGKELVVVDCTQFKDSENTFESEMFGHVKGAFTGADSEKSGYLLQAHQQVLFLDEIHTLSLTAQRKFLRFLQERTFKKKGDNRGLFSSIDFIAVSAGKPELLDMVRREEFLPDLHSRLGSADILVPPLRERPEDIEPLVEHFQANLNEKHFFKSPKKFRISTIKEMEKYGWPANIRQLNNAVCAMMLNASGDIVNPEDFAAYLKTTVDGVMGGTISPERSLKENADAMEIEQIISALKHSRRLNEAAARLGIDRFKLYRRLSRFGIDPESYLRK